MQAEVMEKVKNGTKPKLRFESYAGDWQEKELKEVLTFINGRAYKQEELLTAGKYPVLRVGNFFTNESWYYSDMELEEHKYCDRNDLLYAWSASFGPRIWEGDKVIYHYHIWKVLCSSEMSKDFAFHLLGWATARMKTRTNGFALQHITKGTIETWKSRIPTLPEQQKIAAFLGAVDRKIQQLKRKQALLEQYKKGVVQQLFSQELRFKKKDGGEYPEWEEKRLGDVCSNVAYGMNASAVEYDGENKYLRITDIDENSREFLQTGLTSPGNELEDKYLLHEGDLLFARTGASVGKSYLYKKADGKVYFAGFLIRFRIEAGVPEFIYAQTRTKEYDRWVTENSMRSGQPGLNAEEYKSFVVQFPSLEEQSRIAGFLMALDAKLAGVAQAVVAAQKWKKGLLQQMFV